MSKLDDIKKGVDELRDKLLVSEPAHFSKKDLIDAFFGALILGLTFAIKGLLIRVTQVLTITHIAVIVITTLLILSAEIYFIGYSRVTKKSERKLGQFWLKRLLAFYIIAIIVAVFLVYVFSLNMLTEIVQDSLGVIKLIAIISMPCAIGAATTDLLKKY